MYYSTANVERALGKVAEQQDTFSRAHVDNTAKEAIRQEYLSNFEQHVETFISRDPDWIKLPAGQLILKGEALRLAKEQFQKSFNDESLSGKMANSTIAEIALADGLRKININARARSLDLLQKQELPFANEQQKEAFISWVCSSTSLQNPEAVLAVAKQAIAQSELFREIAQNNPPLTAQQIAQRMSAIAQESRVVVDKGNSRDSEMARIDANVLAKNAAYVTRLLLQSGLEPTEINKNSGAPAKAFALSNVELETVFNTLNSPEMRAMTAQLKQVASKPEIAQAQDVIRLTDTATALEQAEAQFAAYFDQVWDAPVTLQNISMMPAALRETVKTIAPDAANKMDLWCPAYVPFPQAMQPENMPTNEPQRREFLVKTLDIYGTKELNTEEFVHGRGHITRAYIFANAMCNILEEDGVAVDRNAVLCGITCHDLGREGPGDDRWEEQSANLTKEQMRKQFGENTMGEEYEMGVGNCILRGKLETIEAMLLKSADSLDIGRTVEFDERYFPFLGDKTERRNDREPDPYTVSSPKAQKIRQQLMKEAQILEVITDPYTRNRPAKFHLLENFYDGTQAQQNFVREQYNQLINDIKQEYRDDWKLDADSYVKKIEDIVLKNPDLFPVLSQYYRKN